MGLPESKTFSFGISDSPNIKKVELFLFFTLELFLLKCIFSNLASSLVVQEKNKKLHWNHHQKLYFCFEYHQRS